MVNLGSVACADRRLDSPQWYWCLFVTHRFTLLMAWKDRGQFVCMQLITYLTNSTVPQVSLLSLQGRKTRAGFCDAPADTLVATSCEIEIKHGHGDKKYHTV